MKIKKKDSYCQNCLNKSYKKKEHLENHQLMCLENKPFKVQMPNQYNNILKFKKHYMSSEIPIRIYGDFETINVKESDGKYCQKPSGYCLQIVSDFQDIFPNKTIIRRGKNSDDTFNYVYRGYKKSSISTI